MKQTFTFWDGSRLLKLFIGLLWLPLLGQAQSANVVISQVYTAGGNSGAAYNQDFVELFNRSASPATITGWTIQYAGATGVFGTSSNTYTLTAATIPAGGYYLVGIAAAGTTGAALATDQAATNIQGGLAAASGKIALANNATTVTVMGANTFSSNVVDAVGYGTTTGNTANAYEGTAPAPAPSTAASAIFRANGGCTDTNSNSTDFANGQASPHNASTPANVCSSPVLVANPAAMSFSAVTGQVANTATYTLAGYNLAATSPIAISSSDAAVLVSATGAAGSFARTISLTTTATGTITQTITVQYTAPATAGITNAIISNSDGSRTATVAVTGLAIQVYTWNGSSTSFSSPTSWTPTRTTPGNSDVLLFNGATTPTATVVMDYTSAQTIGQLQFINNIIATLSTDAARSLTLDNNIPGDDFVIGAGSTVTLTGSNTTAAVGLNIMLTGLETATVSGTLIFAGYSAAYNGQHSLQATGTAAVQFVAGSLFRTTATYDGGTIRPFGSATVSSVVFRNGSRYEQLGGSTPFGSNAAIQVLTLEPASYFLFRIPGSTPSLSGRTYGTLEIDINTGTITGANMATIQGALIITNGTISLNLTGGLALQGNVQVNNAATLSFVPTAASTVQLSGSAAQTLGGTSTAAAPITFNTNTTLAINNAAGVTLGLPISVPGILQLTNGVLTTTAARSLTLPESASVLYTANSNVSFVSGPVVRPLSSVGSYVFPVGKGTAFRPLTLNITAPSTAAYYRAEQFEGNPGQNVASSGLTRVSSIRSFTISPFASAAAATSTTAANTPPSSFSGTVTLSFGSDDFVTNPAQLVVANRANVTSAWVNQGYGGSTGSAASGTVTSSALSSFADFALSTTSSDLAVNSLPVALTSFGATRQASEAVQVTWTTASEQHSAYFEVQRSLDGSTFAIVAKVAAQGTTTQAHTYASLDQLAPTTKLYYRLHQVDTDGKDYFSPVVTLAATETATTLALYPNPAHDYLTVAAAGEEVKVIDLAGRVLQTTSLPTSGKLSVELLPAGTYLLRAPIDGQQRVLRFTKE